MSYDDNNIFAKILRGEIPCKKIYEDEFVLSFHDINPQKKIHALVIPKGKYVDLDDFSFNASSEEMVGLLKGISLVAKKLGISVDNGKGYRALANISEDGGQEVPHLHFHLFACFFHYHLLLLHAAIKIWYLDSTCEILLYLATSIILQDQALILQVFLIL